MPPRCRSRRDDGGDGGRGGLAVVVLLAGAVVGAGTLGAAVGGLRGGTLAGRPFGRALRERGADRRRAGAAAATAARAALSGALFGGVRGPLRTTGALRLDRFLLRRAHEPPLRPLGDVEVGVQVRARRVGLDRLGLTELERAVDEGPLVQVFPVHERHRDPGLARAARASRAVEVGLLLVGDGVVDDVGDVVDVDTAGCHVRRHEDVLLAGLERGHGALTLVLSHVAVDAAHVEAAVAQLVHQTLRCALRAREDDRLPRPSGRMRAMTSSLSSEWAR